MSTQNLVNELPLAPVVAPTPAGGWARVKSALSFVDRELSFVKGLSAFTVLSSIVVGYFQYVSTYQEKVKAVGEAQIADAEKTYSDVSTEFAKAITLQQYLFFNYRDALKANTDGDEHALEAVNARAIFAQYDELRTNLRETIDLLARKVETNLDWASDTARDPARAGRVGADPMSRIALGGYNFDCDKYMPDFKDGNAIAMLPVPVALLSENPTATPLVIDWYSAKHQLLALYYCFEGDHNRIKAARAWAAKTTIDDKAKANFRASIAQIGDSFDREALRLEAFLTLAAREIEKIQVKFRPRGWYCHIPVLREIVDGLTGKCSPIRTAQIGSTS